MVVKDTVDGLGYTIETEKRECEPVTWTATNKDTEEKTQSTKENFQATILLLLIKQWGETAKTESINR